MTWTAIDELIRHVALMLRFLFDLECLADSLEFIEWRSTC
jgi:hypothetical protein